MMHHIAAYRHLHAEQLSLQEDTSGFLQSSVEGLQTHPRDPCLFAVINYVMIVGVHVEQHQPECNVVRLDILVTGARIREGWCRLPVDHVPRRLGEEHATHVAAPRRVVAPIEFIDGNLGDGISGRGHRAWAHNQLKFEEHWTRGRKLEER